MSALSPFQQSAILGLCRERVPLGVQARGLKLDRRDVKAAALDFLKQGDIGELPADDIRAGRAFSWPKIMLPDAPDFEAGANLRADAANEAAARPKLSDRRFLALDALAHAPKGAAVSFAVLGDCLALGGFQGSRVCVRVLMSELRRLGFVITFDGAGDGYVMSAEDRAKWIGGDHA